MKRKALALTFVLALLFSAVAGVLVVNIAKANPFIIFRPVNPIEGTIPPVITIFSPENNTAYSPINVYISFYISAPQPPNTSNSGLSIVKCTLDNESIGFYFCNRYSGGPPGIPQYSYANNLALPEGNHSLVLYSVGVVLPGDGTIFYLYCNSTVFFTTDSTVPGVSFVSVENKTYETSDVPLNFTVNEAVSQISYSLDGQANVTVAGNTTLTGLPNGFHNVTAYPANATGNSGEPKTVTFSVEAPFPTTWFVTAVTSVIVVSTGLIVYFRKRKRQVG
jgi:hypothetical protein